MINHLKESIELMLHDKQRKEKCDYSPQSAVDIENKEPSNAAVAEFTDSQEEWEQNNGRSGDPAMDAECLSLNDPT